jgi:hypothetical protein
MKASELRIGNYVFKDGEIFSIQILHISHTNIGIEPIPLTEDWLLRFGFDKKIVDAEQNFYQVNEMVDIDDKVYWKFYRNNEGLSKLQYVHQLQNLYFALTGEELTIKEPAV